MGKSTADQFSMFPLMILEDSGNAIFLQASADGPTPCAGRGGQTIDLFGQDHPHANHSALQVNESGATTRDTSPPILSDWSGPPAPLCCLASRSPARLSSEKLQKAIGGALKEHLHGRGSTIYQTVWKPHTTPLGRVIFRLQASARPIKDSEHFSLLSGWGTPRVGGNGQGSQIMDKKGETKGRIEQQAVLAGWPTPTVRNHKDTGDLSNSMTRTDGKSRLDTVPRVASMAGWNTLRATDGSNGGPNQANGALSADAALAAWTTENGPARITADGNLLTGCSAEMANGGQLRPAHSRWLMGYPREWDECAIRALQKPKKR